MKPNVFTLFAIYAIAFGGFAVAALGGYAVGQMHGETSGFGRDHEFILERIPRALGLTAEQREKTRGIIDQARPELLAIKTDARQKKRTVIDRAMSQIAPLLTPEQQKHFENLQKARQDFRNAHDKLQVALKASPPPF